MVAQVDTRRDDLRLTWVDVKTTEEVVGAGQPRARGGHTMVALGRDKLVVFGGRCFDGERSEEYAFRVYDTVLSGNLSTVGPAPASAPSFCLSFSHVSVTSRSASSVSRLDARLCERQSTGAARALFWARGARAARRWRCHAVAARRTGTRVARSRRRGDAFYLGALSGAQRFLLSGGGSSLSRARTQRPVI